MMAYRWLITDCRCPLCRSDHRDLVSADIYTRRTTHKAPRVVQMCDRCLAAKIGQAGMASYLAIKERLWAKAEAAAGKSSGPRSGH